MIYCESSDRRPRRTPVDRGPRSSSNSTMTDVINCWRRIPHNLVAKVNASFELVRSTGEDKKISKRFSRPQLYELKCMTSNLYIYIYIQSPVRFIWGYFW